MVARFQRGLRLFLLSALLADPSLAALLGAPVHPSGSAPIDRFATETLELAATAAVGALHDFPARGRTSEIYHTLLGRITEDPFDPLRFLRDVLPPGALQGGPRLQDFRPPRSPSQVL